MRRDPCDVTVVSSFYRALELEVCGGDSVFMINGVFGLDVCGFFSVCSVYEAFRLVLFYLHYFSVAWRSV